MPQISTQEFERLPLRVHDFLAGVPLHDVWAINLPRSPSGITLDQFLETSSVRSYALPGSSARVGRLSLLVGRLLGWGPQYGWLDKIVWLQSGEAADGVIYI